VKPYMDKRAVVATVKYHTEAIFQLVLVEEDLWDI
jgi:hypothetical protein